MTNKVTGYGSFWAGIAPVYAHRAAVAIRDGIPLEALDGSVVRHSCDNRRCVNPDHLIIGTQKENIQDSIDRNRFAQRGESHSLTHLTWDDVRSIRSMYVRGTGRVNRGNAQALMQEYGISQTALSRIVTNKNWREQ